MSLLSTYCKKYWLAFACIGGLLSIQGITLFIYGQPLICTCGYIKLWEGVVLSSGNSQHLSDWYTFSHIIHGFIFYGLLRLFFPRMPVLWRLAIATGVEVSWELSENTPAVINAYRQQALAQGYTGDSIINSLSDTVAMVIGFLLTWRLKPWVIILIALVLEGISLYFIRDGLSLNVLNFIHQFQFIKDWQAGM